MAVCCFESRACGDFLKETSCAIGPGKDPGTGVSGTRGNDGLGNDYAN
jgi:hypothetical protein